MSEKKYNQEMDNFDNDLGFENLLRKFVTNAHWFVISVIICFGLAYCIAQIQTPLHLVHAKVLINDSNKPVGTDMLGLINGGSGAAVDNEAEVLRTRYLMERVVTDMKLNVTYFAPNNFKDIQLYSAPFVVDIVESVDTIQATKFKINFLPNQKIELLSDVLDTTVTFSKPIRVNGVGVIQILKTAVAPALPSYSFTLASIDQTTEKLVSQMEVLVPLPSASVITIDFKYPVPKKGEEILNRLLYTYVQTGVEDRNLIADSTYSFIQNRLKYLGGELGTLEGNIQTFRQKNQITQISEQATLLIANSSEFVNNLAEVETKISVLTSLQEYLQQNVKGDRVVPSSLVVNDPLFSLQVERYNALLADRARRLMGVTETNPVIVNIDQEVADIRRGMLASLSSSKNSLSITRNNLASRIKSVEGQVQSVPVKERNYLDLARQQKIKEELFIYLMQKGEETAISKTNNISNSKNIEPPKSESLPASPRKAIYYFIGIFLGLVLPAAIIYLRFLLNFKIDSKADVTQRTSVPIIGEISRNTDSDGLIVGHKSRSAIAEQFRAIRTNLSFYLKQPLEKVILITSSVSGEGKSFISINLANVLALSGKKVLLMEMDLRKPGLSSKFGIKSGTGFTNYIIDENLEAKDIIKPLELSENMFIITSGALPPNPAEMLMSTRASKLINEIKEDFDFVIIDAPPVGVVTDAQLLADHADLCIYIARQNFTLKSQLNIVEELNRNSRMRRLGIIINDIQDQKGSGYGYNYGNYGEGETQKTIFSKFKRIFKRK